MGGFNCVELFACYQLDFTSAALIVEISGAQDGLRTFVSVAIR